MLIAGGGTGGHLYPGIALARELQRRDPATDVTFVGTAAGIEARVIPREGFPLDLIRGGRAEGQVDGGAAARDWRCCRCRPWTRGGCSRAGGPTWWWASAATRRGRCWRWRRCAGYPTLLLEQNALPGVTNRLLAPLVGAAAVNFEEALRFFPRTGFVAGNPVRAGVLRAGGHGGA